MLKLNKIGRVLKAYNNSKKEKIPIWTQIWITERCNLSCDYCNVYDNNSADPPIEQVKEWISHSKNLGSAIIDFMGGEPLIRKDIFEIIKYANSLNLLTLLTTNGKNLTNSKLEGIIDSKLDLINLSLDGVNKIKSSEKTLENNVYLLESINKLKDKGIQVRLNKVLSKDSLIEVPKILEISRIYKVPVSFGLVDNLSNIYSGDRKYYSSKEEKYKLSKTIENIQTTKLNGGLILNPDSYFSDALKSLNNPLRIDCDVGSYMIQISTRGNVYICSKLNENRETNIQFLSINQDYFKDNETQKIIQSCSKVCFSACAYSTNYYRRNLKEAIKILFK